MDTLTGKFRISAKAGRVMLAVMILGFLGLAALPAGWEMLRSLCLIIATFTGGALASQHAAIWEAEA